MLFNSFEFVFVFLPATLLGFFGLARFRLRAGLMFLAIASLVFYGAWDARFVLLLLASIVFNFLAARHIARALGRARTAITATAIAADLALLVVFKYANFFAAGLGALAGAKLSLPEIVLPIGISFYTFTQIAFLVDVQRGRATEYAFVNYLLFVTWFPHLVAGPVIHHAQVMPQFAAPGAGRLSPHGLAQGLTVFVLGLAKKVLIADSLGEYASAVFDSAAAGRPPGMVAAWSGAFSYALQLYFDFSGYSDMACGLSRMFGVRLPQNFDAPYRATSVIDFWRRWHMTLSQFLRDYLYIPLGGNRHGPVRRYANLMATMLLGGLWHGANWTFVAWGAIHGVLLLVNHAWRALWRTARVPRSPALAAWGRASGAVLTFMAVVLAWIPFRSADFPTAARMFAGLVDFASMPSPGGAIDLFAANLTGALARFMSGHPVTMVELGNGAAWPAIVVGLVVATCGPTVIDLVGRDVVCDADGPRRASGASGPVALDGGGSNAVAPSGALRWKASAGWAVACGLVLGLVLINLGRISPFLYFQF